MYRCIDEDVALAKYLSFIVTLTCEARLGQIAFVVGNLDRGVASPSACLSHSVTAL